MNNQEDIVALTSQIRSFSDSLTNLKNTFKDSSPNGVYSQEECHANAHYHLGEVLGILKEILSKHPLLHSIDVLNAARDIIKKIKTYNYAGGSQGPPDYYTTIDQLALSFSSSVSDYLHGDKDASSAHSPNAGLDQDEEGQEDEFDPKQYDEEEYDARQNESEDSLDANTSFDNVSKSSGGLDIRMSSNDNDITLPSSPVLQKVPSPIDLSIQRTNELDKTLLNIEGSVEMALSRTKVWTKYSKEILNYLEKRSNLEAECSKQISKLAQTTKGSIEEESYLPFQSIFVTALENDIHFSNNYNKNCSSPLQSIIDKLSQRQRDHDNKRSKIKNRWKNELKKVTESRESLKNAKSAYLRKQKELEKFTKQQQDGKDEKGGFSIRKKGQEDFIKSADDSEEQYKQCVREANVRQQELERVKSESLIGLRKLVYQCDMTMKQITTAYFQMMDNLLNPLPVQYRALADSCKNYEEGQQFADFVKLQQSTSNQSMCPHYQFESYKGEGGDRFNSMRGGDVMAISSDDYPPRRYSVNSESEKPKQAWGSLPRNKGSATDDTDSLSSRSLPPSPTASPSTTRKEKEQEIDSDDDQPTRPAIKNQKLSSAAKMHKFKKLRAASKCKECESYVYFNGFECEKCGMICHKKCLEKLAIKCGNKRMPRKMTTFGVDFHQHLEATKRKDIPYIMEKCIDTIDEIGLSVKGIYRVSGVKSKVEKLCQQFETGGHLVDLSSTPPHFITSVLKLYLRQLPEPLLTFKLYSSFIRIATDSLPIKLSELDDLSEDDASKYEDIIKRLHDVVKNLPSANFYTAAKLIRHLKRVADNCEENQMTISNLAIVFGPTLLRPEGDPQALTAVLDASHQTRAVELLIVNDRIFQDDTITIKCFSNADKYKSTIRQKKTIETVHESPIEHKRDDSNIASEFREEVLFMVEKSNKRIENEKLKFDSVTVQLPGQVDVINDYDNLPNARDNDILSDLPVIPTSTPQYVTQNSSDTTDYESAHSRLSSVESLLSEVASVERSESTNARPLAEEEEDDDLWMNQFGKEFVDKTTRSISANETPVVVSNTFSIPSMKKKTSTPHGRLETTTYSFSIGNIENISTTEKHETTTEEIEQILRVELEPWVKRDSKERQPVRKHLKAVNVKTTVNTVTDQTSPKTTRNNVNRLSFETSPLNMNEENCSTPLDDVSSPEKHVTRVENIEDSSAQRSPTKQPPMVLPKPKKPLDKKSWTADLIKSKTQKIPEQPQPGSLNERLLNQGRISEDENIVEETSTKTKRQNSVKEIRNRFQNNNLGTQNETSELSKGSEEKYV